MLILFSLFLVVRWKMACRRILSGPDSVKCKARAAGHGGTLSGDSLPLFWYCYVVRFSWRLPGTSEPRQEHSPETSRGCAMRQFVVDELSKEEQDNLESYL
ncbi:MAG: hypothetical protein KJ730_10440, partial [Proteobacteria bacterium]|nr:hypothetical protein [Pseudomonadota bacterium]